MPITPIGILIQNIQRQEKERDFPGEYDEKG